MVSALRAIDPAEDLLFDPRISEAADQLNLLSVTNPQWLQPFVDELVLDLPDRFPAGFDAMCILLRDLKNVTVEVLAERARSSTYFFDWWLLAAVDSELGRQAVAEGARTAGQVSLVNELGIEVPASGSATWRFSSQRLAMEVGDEPSRHRWEPLDADVANDEQVRWVYFTLDAGAIATMPLWEPGLVHLFSIPHGDPGWTAYSSLDGDGRLIDVSTDLHDDYDDDEESQAFQGWDDVLGSQQALPVTLRPFAADLVYCNSHVELSPELLAVVGGPPVALYGSPDCRSCHRLMFHVATTTKGTYGEGFRSLYLCETCEVVATRAKYWN